MAAPGLAEQADDAQTQRREARWLGGQPFSVIDDLVGSHHH